MAQSGTVKDTDGNTYKTVSINNRVWMAENLRTTKLNNGETIKVITVGQKETISVMYWYDNNKNSANSKAYGALYNYLNSQLFNQSENTSCWVVRMCIIVS